jgi:N-acetylglucosamine-6-phosphate deacetylase
VKVMVEEVGVSLTDALTMVTSTPAALIGASGLGRLGPGLGADFVHLSADLGLTAVWRAGQAQMVS